VVKGVFYPTPPCLLPKNHPLYLKWRESLKKRPPSWCTGKNKFTDLRVKKISDTFRRKKIDNFASWRNQARISGLIPSSYPSFRKSVELAFLIGLVLGDGHVEVFPRTERVSIALGTDKPKLIDFAASIVEKVFSKKPTVRRESYANVARVDIYQKYISKRLSIPSGDRGNVNIILPTWIRNNKRYLLSCLRGLFEAEGYLSIHLPTCTYNFAFCNRNISLLKFVKESLSSIGLHPEVRSIAIRLRRREEVKYFRDLINFRKYGAGWCSW
jgi:hypothetical protein